MNIFIAALKDAPFGTAFFKDDGSCIWYNSSYTSILGLKNDLLEDHNILNLSLWETNRELLEIILDIQKNGGSYNTNIYYVSDDDRKHLLEIYIGSIIEDNSRLLSLILLKNKEINIRQKALLEEIERYRNAFYNSPIGLYRTTPDGKILLANPALINMLAFDSFEDLVKRNLELEGYSNLNDPRSVFKEKLEKSGGLIGYENAWLTKDGRLIYVRENARVIKKTDGSIYYEGTVEDITERVLSEKALKESNDRFKILFYENPDPIFIANSVTGIIQDCNESACNLLLFPKEEILGKHFSDFFIKERRKFALSTFNFLSTSANPGDKVKCFESIVLSSAYKEVPVEILLQIILINEQKNFYVVLRDISERKEAEEILRISEERFRRIFDEGPLGMVVTGLDYKFLNANQKFIDMTGYSLDELRRITFIDITHPDDIAKSYEHMNKDSLNFFTIQKRYIHKNNSIIWINLTGTIIKDSKGKPLYNLAFIEDITDKKKTEEAIKESETKYRYLASNIPNGSVLLFDKDLRYILAEGTEISKNGYDKNLIEGRTIYELWPEDVVKQIEPYYKKTFKGEENLFEIYMHNSYYEVRTLPVISEEKNIFAGMAMVQNISQRKFAEKQLKEINESKDKFFSIIAHDLKSPFTGLLGLTQFLVNDIDILSKEEIKKFITNIYKSTKNVFDLLENLLQWSSFQTGRIKYTPEYFNITELIEYNLNLYSVNASRKNISFLTNIHENFEVFADKQMIDTVIRNLLSNSIKFTPDNGEIRIEIYEDDDKIKVIIKDKGVGISEENINNLFVLGKRVSTPGTNEEKGTGLGLILCKEFIENNNGSLYVESEVNKGTKFTFYLPLAK